MTTIQKLDSTTLDPLSSAGAIWAWSEALLRERLSVLEVATPPRHVRTELSPSPRKIESIYGAVSFDAPGDASKATLPLKAEDDQSRLIAFICAAMQHVRAFSFLPIDKEDERIIDELVAHHISQLGKRPLKRRP
jgi:hypothetical protein